MKVFTWKSSVAILFALGVWGLVACSDEAPVATPTGSVVATVEPAPSATATVTRAVAATASPTVTKAATATPAGTNSKGVPAVVDEAIAAVFTKDAARLASLLHFWPRACTEAQGIGAVSCPAGSPGGTVVMVIGSGFCEGSFLKPGDAAIATTTFDFVRRATKLYGVLKAPSFPDDPSVPGTYQVVFEPGVWLSMDDLGVTYLSGGCGASVADLIAARRFGPNPEYVGRP